jgi:hypothetical protein
MVSRGVPVGRRRGHILCLSLSLSLFSLEKKFPWGEGGRNGHTTEVRER